MEQAALVRELYEGIWSSGNYDAIERIVAMQYTIHSDPGDAWDGKALNRAEYQGRVEYSRRAFPDLEFFIDDLIAAGERVAVRWRAEGTHRGDLNGIPATGKRLGFAGQTFYEISGDRVAGHWQVVDRISFIQQLR